MDVNARLQGQAYRQIKVNCEEEAEKERALIARQRGIMRRIVDSNVRLMGMGYNKLIEEWKARQNELKAQLKFVIKALTDKDANHMLMAYNSLKERCNMLNGVGLGDSQQRKEKDRILRRVMDVNARLQGQAYRQIRVNCEEEAEKERVLMAKQRGIMRRIVDSNTRLMG